MFDDLKSMFYGIRYWGIDFFIIRFRGIHRKIYPVLIAGVVLLFLFLFWQGIITGYSHDWSGFAEQKLTNGEVIPEKKLWDWLELLLIPLFLSLGALLFTWSGRKSEQKIALDQKQEAILSHYIDSMADLLLKTDPTQRYSSQAIEVARARTVATLRQLDGERKGILIKFIHEAGLIATETPAITLENSDLTKLALFGVRINQANFIGANIEDADLTYARLTNCTFSHTTMRRTNFTYAELANSKFEYTFLENATFYSANLPNVSFIKAWLTNTNFALAELQEAVLRDANLSKANFRKANLCKAYLLGGKLMKANFRGANLSEANLEEADLRGANFTGADLTGANLTNAIVSRKQLKRAKSLKNANLAGIRV